MKFCEKCKVEKDVSEYHKHASNKDGLQKICKGCRSKRKTPVLSPEYGITCKKCKEIFVNETELVYYNYKSKRTGQIIKMYSRLCKVCDAFISREYYRKNITAKKDYDLKRHFGIGIKEYNNMLKKQGRRCAICCGKETNKHQNGKIRKLAVDHCHETGKVRGLLCSSCNHGIGKLKDSVKILKKAIVYLTKDY